ncbi:MAG TPA: hypothetical protein VL069_03140 [Opitutus sp.]|nr:hypothetical protein [Opitutus sp.]
MSAAPLWLLVSFLTLPGYAAESIEAQLQEIVTQNRRLQEQVQAQQALIDKLSAEVAAMRGATDRHEQELETLKEREPNVGATPSTLAPSSSVGMVRISGEAGLAFFSTGPTGRFPDSEFRVDDAKLFVEAQVWKDVYAFAEFNLFTREINDEALHLGELYVDFENVSGLWNADNLLNVRVGRFNVPFGEEYQSRGVIKNPLISHSLSDLWGVDEGVEIYGAAGAFQYVLAVQNGGHSLLHDFDPDKSVTGRISYNPRRWLHLSASAMRTGNLSAKDDLLSELWMGNGFFRPLGAVATTRTFHAELYELDAVARWKTGHLAAAVGRANYDDDDTSQDNARTLDYHFVEIEQGLGEKLYAAARYSAMRVPGGYPLIGFGGFGRYFYSGLLTERLERLSLGMGYRLGPPLVLKFEYAIEDGRANTGVKRERENFLSTEVGLKF